MIEINLIPDVKIELLKAQRQRRNVISISIVLAIAAVAVVMLLVSYALGVQTLAKQLASNSINEESKKLLAVQDLSKTLTIQTQLSKLSDQHDSKHVTSRLFEIISTTVPEGDNRVAISRLSFDAAEKTILIEGEAVNGYEALEVFKKTIAQTKFQYAVDNDAAEPINIAESISDGDRRYGENADGQRVLRFTVSFKYPEALFSPASESGRIVAPNRQNATDSNVGVPSSLFTNGGGDEN